MTQNSFQVPSLPDANDVLMGGGTTSLSIEQQGVPYGGRITGKPRAYHKREFSPNGDGPLAYYPSGDPIIGINCDVQAFAPSLDDSGIRRLYLDKPRQLSAVREAVRRAGAEGLEAGGELFITWTGTEPSKGAQPANTYSATYTRPSQAVTVPGGPQGPPPAQQYAQPPQQQAPQQNLFRPVPTPDYSQQQYQPQQPHQPQNVSYTQPVPQQAPEAPAPAGGAGQGRAQVTETQAAAMRNAGIDTSIFDVVPG